MKASVVCRAASDYLVWLTLALYEVMTLNMCILLLNMAAASNCTINDLASVYSYHQMELSHQINHIKTNNFTIHQPQSRFSG